LLCFKNDEEVSEHKMSSNRFPSARAHLVDDPDVGTMMKKRIPRYVRACAVSACLFKIRSNCWAFRFFAGTTVCYIPWAALIAALRATNLLETTLAYEAECYGKTARDDENDRTRILRWQRFRVPGQAPRTLSPPPQTSGCRISIDWNVNSESGDRD
jgi:hypothetical protein